MNAKQPLYVDWSDLRREILDHKTPCMMFDESTHLVAWSTTPDDREAVYLLENDRGKRFAIYTYARPMAEIQWVSLPAGSRNVVTRGDRVFVEFEVPKNALTEQLQVARDCIGRGERP